MFENLCLHSVTKAHLEAALLAPAGIILSGGKGLGKAHAGEELAAALLKTTMERLEYHPDFYRLVPVNGVIQLEAVQKMCSRGSFCASVAEQKVFLIDDANLMTTGAQNALLKFLEESGENCRCIFVAHEDLIPTIRSRCEVVKFQEPTGFREWISRAEDVNELAFLLSDGVPGIYWTLVEEPEFLKEAGKLLSVWSGGCSKAELLRAFHLMKEKDEEMFLDRFGAEHLVYFFKSMRCILLDVVEIAVGNRPEEDRAAISYVGLSRRYSIADIAGILEVIDSQIGLLRHKGKYTKNDLFDFLVGLK